MRELLNAPFCLLVGIALKGFQHNHGAGAAFKHSDELKKKKRGENRIGQCAD